jgi:hypothetical protein
VVLGAVYSPEDDTVPPVALHVTAVLSEPVTVAVNCCVAPGASAAEVGERVTTTPAGAVTVTAAEADFVVSTALVAVTLYVPAVLGAVYRPVAETVPPVALHVTAPLLEPVTVAVNCCVPFVVSEAEVGEIATATAVTVTVAEADTLVSAALVAVTV